MDDILAGKTAFISGGSRGIGFAIAKKLAKHGVQIVIGSKTTTPQPTLEGTIFTAVQEITDAGGKAMAVPLDIRFEDQIESAVAQTIAQFGGIDILINNASAIFLAETAYTPSKKFDLMHQINVRGTWLVSKHCLPYLKKSEHAHILSLSPPIDLQEKWFENHTAYTMSKFGMSMVTFGLAAELRHAKVRVNSLWPKTTIATAAVQNLLGGDDLIRQSRTPEIVADAAYHILCNTTPECTGQFFIDEEVLAQAGVKDFTSYAVDPSSSLAPDIFVEL